MHFDLSDPNVRANAAVALGLTWDEIETLAAGADDEPRKEDTMTETELRIPFPLRDGVTAWLTLPPDLTGDEAERLAVYVRSLAKPAA